MIIILTEIITLIIVILLIDKKLHVNSVLRIFSTDSMDIYKYI